MLVTNPFLTPSTCKSTHHIPDIPSISQRDAFLTSDPTGSLENTRTYSRLATANSGTRIAKRRTWNGKYSPDGCGGTGKNGAIPEPTGTGLACTSHSKAGHLYLCPGTESTSPCWSCLVHIKAQASVCLRISSSPACSSGSSQGGGGACVTAFGDEIPFGYSMIAGLTSALSLSSSQIRILSSDSHKALSDCYYM